MLIPINTDAPLYHFPYATIGLIFINCVCFVATGFALNERLLDWWLLEYGNGINPLEWIPAAFAHASVMHLLGNMFFLWGFGLVVEGKLGWRVFVPVYLALAAGWGAGVDLLTVHRTDNYIARSLGCEDAADYHRKFASGDSELMAQLAESGYLPGFYYYDDEEQPVEEDMDAVEIPLDGEFGDPDDGEPAAAEEAPAEEAADEVVMSELSTKILSILKGRCLGASGVIFALMAISLVWAPKNEMHIVGFLGYRPVSFEVTIMTFSLWYLALNVFELLIMKFQMGSSGLHMVGAVLGFGVGVVFLKKEWVDCEKWDLFAVMSGKYGRFADDNWGLASHGNVTKIYKDVPLPEDEEEVRGRKSKGALSNVNQFIDSGDFLSAADELFTLRIDHPDLCPSAERTKKLALGLLQAHAYDEAEIWLQEFIDRFPDQNVWARIRMAQLLQKRQRPRAALQTLKGISLEGASDQLKALAKKIVTTAKEQVRNGVQDAEPEW